jgi:hypothetical protein
VAFGGQLPATPQTLKAGDNRWQNLLLDLDEEKESCVRVLEGVRLAERGDADIVAGLRRIREEELRAMLAKSEPDAVHVSAPTEEAPARQKEAGLEQQQAAWMEHQQAVWEASGKPPPWAEWDGSRK